MPAIIPRPHVSLTVLTEVGQGRERGGVCAGGPLTEGKAHQSHTYTHMHGYKQSPRDG